MEQQTHTEKTPLKAVHIQGSKGTQTYALTVFELETIYQVVNARGNQGSAIKDLRLYKSVSDKIKAATPEKPQPPKQESGATPEQQQAWQAQVQEWQKALETRIDTEIEVELTPVDTMIIKNKLSTFPHFAADEDIRDRVLALADKLDIK